MNQLRHAYDILGIPPGATPAELRRAYRDLVRVWHPDRFGDDPRLQQKAQERLKEINEAYRLIKAAQADVRPPRLHPASPVPPGPAAKPRTAEAAAPRPRPAVSAQPAVQHRQLTTFLSFWPNVLLLIFLVAAARLAYLRYGVSAPALGYLLQMAVMPLLFALVCNSRLGGRRALWGSYLLVLAVAFLLLILDGLALKKELRDAATPRYPAAEEQPASGGGLGGTGGQLPAGEPLPPSERKTPVGPVAPSEPNAPVVPSPAPPMPPSSPVGR